MRISAARIAGVVAGWVISSIVHAPAAHADYFNYPCTYPFVGGQVDVKVIVDAGGQYCDGPMEINGSHYHCVSLGASVSGGGIALAPLNGFTFGALGAGGIGGSGGRCSWNCPDNTESRPPNPPAAWVKHLVLDPKYNDCRDHMTPAGPDSTPQAPDAGPPAPGELQSPPGSEQGQLPTAAGRPEVGAPAPGKAAVTLPDPGSPLTPGGPFGLP